MPLSIKGPLSGERGIVLVTALMITLLLTLVVIALSFRVGLFSIGTRGRMVKSQSVYTAQIGLNQARYFLLAKDCVPPHWEACMAGVNTDQFTDISYDIKSVFSKSMPEIVVAGERYKLDLRGSVSHNGTDNYSYKVLAKTTNIPTVLNVVVVSEKQGGSKTVVDAGLIFTKPVGGDYKQLGQGGTREGLSGETLGADAGQVRARF
ncbi:hypothetical protein M1B72_12445 [Geomonas paludis]|uniref:Type 4 fimbrial biogenesis protein PilX N-terminal domain-containing protein n=1 Tax=Geomonas paludis TaxID=2740185 RepID=A0A6V8MVW2_9BACT|nr:pilus assembly PilX N-terminal domain-containing protein [Geomonas paludis]UPU34258.1 hypothetical protein M1B72_12445 [Geomonas paludis]GFO64240.1 hypothetical protein GMPD_21590 [Geomonas paludis]